MIGEAHCMADDEEMAGENRPKTQENQSEMMRNRVTSNNYSAVANACR